MKRLTIPDEKTEGGWKRAVIDPKEVKKHAMTLYWTLKKYEDTGLTPEQIRQIDVLYAKKCREVADLQKAQRWIPVEERLPEDEEMVMVTCQTKSGRRSVNRAWYGEGFWHGSGSMSGVIAWMPLPEPYQPEWKDRMLHTFLGGHHD